MANITNYLEQDKLIAVLPAHAYFIPFSKAKDCFKDRKKSDLFYSLNGTWKIKEYESILEIQDSFYKDKLTKEINVPSVVQLNGFDAPQYINTAYPIPFNPPKVPLKNKGYHYQKVINFSIRDNKKYVLCFEGVDSCFYLYVNGKFVGYSYISHHISEFDVSGYLVNGENHIDVLVFKWCFGTYLEDQDKLRFTGIFRDVYLLTRDNNCIEDYKIETSLNGAVKFTLLRGKQADVTFNNITKKVYEKSSVIFRVKNPHLWSAEDPYLYEMIIHANDEYIGEKVGICESFVKNGLYFFNNETIKIKGVNRHDFSPINGPAVTEEEIKKDLLSMKKLNVNAIRTSHYPSSPYFYRLCDEMGFYVMSESDLESHGSSCYKYNGSYRKDFSDVAKDKKFKNQFVLRQALHIPVYRNRSCVFMWSIGNEAGYGENSVSAIDEIRKLDPRPIHYEGTKVLSKDEEPEASIYYNSPLDVVSFMYPDYTILKEVINNKREKRPVILCEYCHSMGNSPGDFKQYWDIMYSSPRYVGGFVWEWKDHALLIDNHYLYGGDFGEKRHDGNFCIDGIVSSDLKITPKSLEMKKAYQPFKFDFKNKFIYISSLLYFADFTGEVILIYKANGNVIKEKKVQVNIPAKGLIKIPYTDAELLIVKIYKDNEVIAESSLNNYKYQLSKEEDANCKFTDNGRYILVSEKQNSYVIDKTSGNIVSIKINKEEYLSSEVYLNVYRAPTDNDMKIKQEWLNAYYDDLSSVTESILIKDNSIVVKANLSTQRFEPIAKYTLTYRFILGGVNVSIDYSLKKTELPYLPRIGLYFALNKAFDKVRYYGLGPNESYIDKKLASIKDFYESSPKELETFYIKPQENGSHAECNMFSVSDNKRKIIVEGKDFSFSYLPHSVNEYANTKHYFELKKNPYNYLALDFFMSGIGSNSCGPALLEEYRTPKKGKSSLTIRFK